MHKNVVFELNHSRERLDYYRSLKERSNSGKTSPVDKWIEIYSDRVQKLERQASKLGLKTQISIEQQQARLA